MTNNFQEFYKRIGYLRSSGVKMKEIADWISIAPSVLSSLYTTVLPDYFESIKTNHPENSNRRSNPAGKKTLLWNC